MEPGPSTVRARCPNPWIIREFPITFLLALVTSHIQFSSVIHSCPTLCDPMDCSTPGFPVLHHLTELAQTHVHWVGDAIQPSHPLSSPSPPAFNLSQHQGLFQWVASSHQVAKVLELQSQSFQWIFRTDWLVWSPCSPRDFQESCPTPQFKCINSSMLSFHYGLTLTSISDYWKNHNFDYTDLCRFVTVFLPRSKRLLISWLQSPSAVILESKKTVSHCLHCFPIYLHEAMGLEAMILVFWNVEF